MTSSGATIDVLPRLLSGLEDRVGVGLSEHLSLHGPLPRAEGELVELVAEAGLLGRGGARFPTARKLAEFRGGRGASYVVANGCESEPLSAKDALLMACVPHLVLDGAVLAARASGAHEVIIAHRAADTLVRERLTQALGERHGGDDAGVRFSLFGASTHFLAGQETALISQLNGGQPHPTFTPPRPAQRGVRRRPTLVQNVETLAHIALIARHGPAWFRAIGADAEPGSALVSVSGSVANPCVLELEYGTPLEMIVESAGGAGAPLCGILIGGYFGTWIAPRELPQLALESGSLATYGASLGCGAVHLLSDEACPVAETAHVASYLAEQSAHQCGPCIHGTASLASTLQDLARGYAAPDAYENLARWCRELPGRGACHHPNGVVRFVSSALETFAAQFDQHAVHGPCTRCAGPRVLPLVPGPRGVR